MIEICFISCHFDITLLCFLYGLLVESNQMSWSTAILSKVIKSATSMTFSVILGLSITLLHRIWLLLLVEFVFIRHVLWVTRTGSHELLLFCTLWTSGRGVAPIGCLWWFFIRSSSYISTCVSVWLSEGYWV
jgi:hypothetical protein